MRTIVEVSQVQGTVLRLERDERMKDID